MFLRLHVHEPEPPTRSKRMLRFSSQDTKAAASWRARPRAFPRRALGSTAVSADCPLVPHTVDPSLQAMAPQPALATAFFADRLPSYRVATPIAGQGTSAATYHEHPNYISLLDRAHIRAAVDLIIAHMPCHARRAALEVEYTNSVGSEAEELQRRGFELHEVGGAEAIARWAAARARHHPGGRDDKGCAEGTAQALKVARKQLIICGACGALVQLQAARRLARKAGRSRIADGDGCGSSTCTTSHAQPRRFSRGQEERAAGLLHGTHSLVLPPPTTAARTNLWVAPAHLTHAVALRSRGGGSGGDEGEAPVTEQCGDDQPKRAHNPSASAEEVLLVAERSSGEDWRAYGRLRLRP